MRLLARNFERTESPINDKGTFICLIHDSYGYLIYSHNLYRPQIVKVIARDKNYKAIWGAFCLLSEHPETWESFEDITPSERH
jgi:hypothetical protein